MHLKKNISNISQQVNECIPYEHFSSHMKQHNEKRTIYSL
jgi:hypothetical protein